MNIAHGYQCDIYIPKQKGIKQNIIIEADGCYWHGCKICNKSIHAGQEKQIKRDSLRTKELQEKGFRVIRLWEHEIKEIRLEELNQILL